MREEKKQGREGALEEPEAAFACDVRRESAGRMKGKVKRRQVETRAVLEMNCHYRRKDMGMYLKVDSPTSVSMPLYGRPALQERG